jgi:thiol-disulfide isomerase/thioredoxin
LYIFLFFTGSDWCGWCIRLQNEVFKTPEFTAWVKQHAILVELDYPRRTPQTEEIKQQNAQLQQMFQVHLALALFLLGLGSSQRQLRRKNTLSKTDSFSIEIQLILSGVFRPLGALEHNASAPAKRHR